MSTLIRYVVSIRRPKVLRGIVLAITFICAISCFASYAFWGLGVPSMLCSVFLALWLGVLTGSFMQHMESRTTTQLDLVAKDAEPMLESAVIKAGAALAAEAVGGGGMAGASDQRGFDTFADWSKSVDRVAALYSLSVRESEVLALLVRGRDAARISAALCISPHTVKSHLYSIYRKADVHSSQEIIDVFEEICFAER